MCSSDQITFMNFDSDNYPSASFQTLFDQAPSTADAYLRHGVDALDRTFGKGYAKANPELLAAYIQACATDFTSAAMSKTLGAGLQRVADALDRIGGGLDSQNCSGV